VFDPNILGEYLDWTGNKGGALVTSNNITTRSDLRLYESDKNATVRALFAQGDNFLDTCVDLLGRSMNTVPSGVQLGAIIEAIPIKPINTTFDFDEVGALRLSGKIRVFTIAGARLPSSLSLQISNYSSELVSEPVTGSSVFGRSGNNYGIATYFPFSVSGPGIRTATFFNIQSSALSTQSFPISGDAFIVPSLTTLSSISVTVTVAVLPSHTCRDLSLRIAAPLAQHGTLAPSIKNAELTLIQRPDILDGYILCSGHAVLGGVPTGLVTVEVAVQGRILDTYLVNGGAAGW
jgi:hypothetical protein